jgi:hypothetical protein
MAGWYFLLHCSLAFIKLAATVLGVCLVAKFQLLSGSNNLQENKHTTCLVMESCNGGDLASLLEARQGNHLDEQDIQMMIVQVPGHHEVHPALHVRGECVQE